MKAAIWSQQSNTFEIADIPRKNAAKGGIVVRVMATAIHHIDVWL